MIRRPNSTFRAITYACIVLCLAASVSFASDCGDADNSGGVDIDDVVYLIAYIFTGGPPPDPGCCESDCPPVVMDFDGNTYFTLRIGDQCWMAQNLKVTHYRNGDPIPFVTVASTWSVLSTGAYGEYANDPVNVETYGRLYNWYAVDDSRNIAPEGWHVPTDDEWKQLEMYLGMSQAEADSTGSRGTDEGGKLKEAGTNHWNSPNTGATNETGFSALPGGSRSIDGYFSSMGVITCFWSSTEYDGTNVWYRNLSCNHSQISRNYNYKQFGWSVRCVRD